MFCNKPTPLYAKQYLDLVITYKEGFIIGTRKRNPLQLAEDDQYDQLYTQLIFGKLFKFRISTFFQL